MKPFLQILAFISLFIGVVLFLFWLPEMLPPVGPDNSVPTAAALLIVGGLLVLAVLCDKD